MKHIKKFNEAKSDKRQGINCKDCGEKIEMYYDPYCPKCDIQDIIKGERGSYCLIPILRYGESYIEDFNTDIVWESICENLHGNDTYLEYRIGDSDGNIMLKQVLDELNIKYPNNEVFFWVSW